MERPPRHPHVVGIRKPTTKENTMADDNMVLLETMRKAISDGDLDFLRNTA